MPPSSSASRSERTLDALVTRIRSASRGRATPLIVALDGRSGAGKSTLAAAAADRLDDCTVVEGDDFYAGGDAAHWDGRSAAEKAAGCIDWRRQRPVLATLARSEAGSWHGYDWEAFDGRLRSEPTTVAPAAVVILDGVYSARPELADLLDLRVLLAADDRRRLDRLRRRDGVDYQDDWQARWTEAEDHYFGETVTRADFDLVLQADPVQPPTA